MVAGTPAGPLARLEGRGRVPVRAVDDDNRRHPPLHSCGVQTKTSRSKTQIGKAHGRVLARGVALTRVTRRVHRTYYRAPARTCVTTNTVLKWEGARREGGRAIYVIERRAWPALASSIRCAYPGHATYNPDICPAQTL